MSGPKPVSEISKDGKGSGGMKEKINRPKDEVFSDVGSSPDSANNAGKIDRKDPKLSESSENKGFDFKFQYLL